MTLREDILDRLRILGAERCHPPSAVAWCGTRLNTTVVWRELELMLDDGLVRQTAEDKFGLPLPRVPVQMTMEEAP